MLSLLGNPEGPKNKAGMKSHSCKTNCWGGSVPAAPCKHPSHLTAPLVRGYNKRSYQEEIRNGIQDDQNSFAVFGQKQVEQRLEDPRLDELHHLLHSAASCQVGHCPHRLLLGLEIPLEKQHRKHIPRLQHPSEQAEMPGGNSQSLHAIWTGLLSSHWMDTRQGSQDQLQADFFHTDVLSTVLTLFL